MNAQFFHPRYWATWIGMGLMRAFSLLPMPVIALFGGALGLLVHALYASRRRVVFINISRCFPELSTSEHRRLTRKHFRGLGQALLGIGIAWWGSPRRLKRLVRIAGLEHYERVASANRRVVFLVPHFLGIEICGVRMSIDLPMVDIYRKADNRLVTDLMVHARTRFQGGLIEHIRGLVPVIRALKAGHPLYYLPDQDPGQRSSSFVPFFGIQTATFNVLGRLADMTQAVVIPCITRQLSWGRGYEVVLRPPLENFPTGDAVADTTRMNAEIENAVRLWPEQYFWVHKRFKTRPPGEPKFY